MINTEDLNTYWFYILCNYCCKTSLCFLQQQQHDKPLASHQTSAAAKYEKDDSPRNEESSSKHTDNDQVDTFGLQRTVGLAGSISINLGTMIGR